jgi:hypothetical protein
MPWIDEAFSHLLMVPRARPNSLQPRSFITPFQRSIQSLLCVWRI